jgi:Skp family chaperone for outer membrane proteins
MTRTTKMDCQYCHNTFKSAYILKTHQEKAKYCLKLQGKKPDSGFVCEFCETTFNRKYILQNHHTVCKAHNNTLLTKIKDMEKLCTKYMSDNDSLEKQLEDALRREQELREDFNKLATVSAKRSTTTNNTTNNLNMGVFDKSAADIKRIVDEKYDRAYLIQGQKGVAIFTNKHVLNHDVGKPPIYVITDRSRGNGKYKISEDEVVTDTGMNGLTKKVYPSIKSKAVFITSTHPNPIEDEEMMSGYHEVFEMDIDNSSFRNCLVKEISEVVQV